MKKYLLTHGLEVQDNDKTNKIMIHAGFNDNEQDSKNTVERISKISMEAIDRYINEIGKGDV